MQASSFNLPTLLPSSRFSDKSRRLKTITYKRPSVVMAIKRDQEDKNYKGSMVDENMIVLRMRIHDIKMSEKGDEVPMEWMEWERQYYQQRYKSDVSEAIGFLQNLLMETRPSLALGILALVMLCVSHSLFIVALQFMNMALLIELTQEVKKAIVSTSESNPDLAVDVLLKKKNPSNIIRS
ncbi:ABC transporter G family member 7-like [Heracleum sosnowskyi]|uniref:ABC transporter G family member 7-like n=1 Tax=Heracleum sosnowskyi TaxID=360622 RepID=A0AAD8MPM6_9APIA|nr:ABC transporter G family member 7-like [Heracleum sosnowskyi]